MISKNYLYVVVGVSDNPEKYGYKVFKDLLDNGYRVVPINPRHQEILGQPCFKGLMDLKKLPDVLIFVVPPVIALSVFKEALDLGIKKFWFQPGAESEEARKLAQEKNVEAVFQACIMIEKNKL